MSQLSVTGTDWQRIVDLVRAANPDGHLVAATEVERDEMETGYIILFVRHLPNMQAYFTAKAILSPTTASVIWSQQFGNNLTTAVGNYHDRIESYNPV